MRGRRGAEAQPWAEGRRRDPEERSVGQGGLLRRRRRSDPALRSRRVKRGEALFGRRRK